MSNHHHRRGRNVTSSWKTAYAPKLKNNTIESEDSLPSSSSAASFRIRARDKSYKSETSVGSGNYRRLDRSSPVFNSKESLTVTPHKNPDDKIATQARLLKGADSEKSFLKICSQIQNLLISPENRSYLSRCFKYLEIHFYDGFIVILESHWKEAGIKHYAKLMSLMLRALDSSDTTISNFLINSFYKTPIEKSSSPITYLILDVILNMIPEIGNNKHLFKFINIIHEQVESVSNNEQFKIFSSILTTALVNCQNWSSSHEIFQDFIDILIGWMINEDEKEIGEFFYYCTSILVNLKPYFENDAEYHVNLLWEIVSDLKSRVSDAPSQEIELSNIIINIKTYEAILPLNSNLEKKTGLSMLDLLTESVNLILSSNLNNENRKEIECLITSTNKCISISPGGDSLPLQNFINNQLLVLNNDDLTLWSSNYLIQFIKALTIWIETAVGSSSLKEEIDEICKGVMNFVDRSLISLPGSLFTHLIGIVHSLLKTRNLALLQNIYEWVTKKLSERDGENVMFVLGSLSDIATNKSSSILSLWALHPSLIELLIKISIENDDKIVKRNGLELLKTHCMTHSHFVSSVASTGSSYVPESPAQNFRIILINFWSERVKLLRDDDDDETEWLFEWISHFLKSSSFYAPSLLKLHPQFYVAIFTQFSKRSILTGKLAQLLEWIVKDGNYSESKVIQDVVRKVCLQILLKEKIREDLNFKFTQILSQLPSVILLPAQLLPLSFSDNNSDKNSVNNLEIYKNESEEELLLTLEEFNSFLHGLFEQKSRTRQNSDAQTDQNISKDKSKAPTKELIKKSVIFLLRSKLKTVLGKAPEFFSQLQHLVKRMRISKKISPSTHQWKLDFIFELEKEILLCINQSALISSHVPENIRSFYVINKAPCTEWLKRMGGDLIEVSLSLKNYPMAYFFSIFTGEDEKAKISLLELEDREGLRGMGSLPAHLYLSSQFENCEKILKESKNVPKSENENISESFDDILSARCKAIQAASMASLESWSNKSDKSSSVPNLSEFNNIPLPGSNLISRKILDIQFQIYNSLNTEVYYNFENYSQLHVLDMLRIANLINYNNSQNCSSLEDDFHGAQKIITSKMLEFENLHFVRSWLIQTNGEWEEKNKNPENLVTEFRAECLVLLGNLLFKEQAFSKSAEIYSAVLNMIEPSSQNASKSSIVHEKYKNLPIFTPEFKTRFYLESGYKIQKSELFYASLSSKNAVFCKLNGDSRAQAEHNFYEKAQECSSNCDYKIKSRAWLIYANYAFERCEAGLVAPILTEVLKSNSVRSYSNYLKWAQEESESSLLPASSVEHKRNNLLSMVRLIKLYSQGHKFNPSEIIISPMWLPLLPQLLKLDDSFVPHIISKFPHEATFFTAAFYYNRNKQRFWGRKNIFNPTVYSFTEANEENFSPKCSDSNFCADFKDIDTFMPLKNREKSKISQSLHYKFGEGEKMRARDDVWESLKFGEAKKVNEKAKYSRNVNENSDLSGILRLFEPCLKIVREIERIGTSQEELWNIVSLKICSDWVKRINICKKDVARDRGEENGDKIRAYVEPILSFIVEFWRETREKSETPADVAFICKNSTKIEELISLLHSTTTLDLFISSYDKFLTLSSSFNSYHTSRLSLSNLSPLLASFNFNSLNNSNNYNSLNNPHTSINYINQSNYNNGYITLPGLPVGVSISSVDMNVYCLPTKTKPKRVRFIGSDGRNYEFLIKGNENLRIDAGVMGLLNIIQGFSGLETRSYAVTPIGERGGLIQIVEDSIPLFVLYKKYLQRSNSSDRHLEMFWKKMNALGHTTRGDNEALLQVYKELKSETPQDLFSKDLFICSNSPSEWYNSVKTFTQDVSMGSGVGHIIGLADRHLDNILINLRNGKLTHVDFSILFGKGELLKVPEKVPFRLTGAIVEALQYPGVNGSFSIYLECILDEFSKNKELLMFAIRNLAESSFIEQGIYICPDVLIKSEIRAAFTLLRVRIKNVWKIMQIIMKEVLESLSAQSLQNAWVSSLGVGGVEKLKRKLFRWRRLLANIDPLVQFIISHASSRETGIFTLFQNIILSSWNPKVMHFWSHCDIEELLTRTATFSTYFTLTEETLQGILENIPDFSEIEVRENALLSSCDKLDERDKIELITKPIEDKISSFVTSITTQKLISDATDDTKLAQMYEGWTPWV